MITFPVGLVSTKYPGYYWHTTEHKLYSIKVGGVLRQIRISFPNKWNRLQVPAYRVSHLGKQQLMFHHELCKVGPTDSEIQYKTP